MSLRYSALEKVSTALTSFVVGDVGSIETEPDAFSTVISESISITAFWHRSILLASDVSCCVLTGSDVAQEKKGRGKRCVRGPLTKNIVITVAKW